MTVFEGSKTACSYIIQMKNNTNERAGYGRNGKKKVSRLIRGTLCSSFYETDEYFVRFRANAQDPPLLASLFFSYVDTRWSC